MLDIEKIEETQINDQERLVQQFFANLRWFSILNIVSVALLFIPYFNILIHLTSLVWASSLVVISLAMLLVSQRSIHVHPVTFSEPPWALLPVFFAVFSGVLWGLGLGESLTNPEDLRFAALVAIAAISGGTLLLSADKAGSVAFAFLSIATSVGIVYMFSVDHLFSLVIILAGLGIIFIVIGVNKSANLGHTLETGQEIGQIKAALKEAKEKEGHLRIELSAAKDEKEVAENNLASAQRNAESAGMAKDEFLATMSHEIRTPLNGILPILEMMQATDLDVDQKDYLDTAIDSSQHLLSIIDDILDYSKIEAGKLELESVGINLRELVASVTEMMSGSAESKNISLRSSIDPAVRLTARGDPVRLRQILTNLVSNAIKFTERGQVLIKVSLHKSTKTHNEILFAIKDTGIGMNKEVSSRLFQAFTQADASTTRLHGGTGLGLVICKRLVELMGGKIGVKSQIGKGSIFWFAVPLLKAAGDIEPARKGLDGARALILGAPGQQFQRYNTFMNSWGLHTLRVDTAIEAMDTLRQSVRMGKRWSYDLVMIDFETVHQGAMTLINNIRAEKNMADTRIVVIAESGTAGAQLKRPQVQGIVISPISEHQLHTSLSVALDLVDIQEIKQAEAAKKVAESVKEIEQDVNDNPIMGHALLVEDNPVNLKVAEKVISKLGMTIETASNGQIAVDKVKNGQYDLILMDCQMPVLDGYQATGQIRELQKSEGLHTPIIAMTANAMAGDRDKCLQAGMDDYLSKPLDRTMLKQTLARWLKRGGAQKPINPAAVQNIPQQQVAHSVIDKQVVEDLIEIMGDDFVELLQIYLQDTPKNLRLMKQAAENMDFENLVTPAHSLKSSSANVGAMSLSGIAKEIELGSREANLQDPAEMVETAEKIFLNVSRELRALIQ